MSHLNHLRKLLVRTPISVIGLTPRDFDILILGALGGFVKIFSEMSTFHDLEKKKKTSFECDHLKTPVFASSTPSSKDPFFSVYSLKGS